MTRKPNRARRAKKARVNARNRELEHSSAQSASDEVLAGQFHRRQSLRKEFHIAVPIDVAMTSLAEPAFVDLLRLTKLANSPRSEPAEGSETPDYGTAFEAYERLLKSQTEKKQDTARSSAQYYVPSHGSFLPLRRFFQRTVFSRYGMKYASFLLGLRSVLAKYP